MEYLPACAILVGNLLFTGLALFFALITLVSLIGVITQLITATAEKLDGFFRALDKDSVLPNERVTE
jgi:hypothetical protein